MTPPAEDHANLPTETKQARLEYALARLNLARWASNGESDRGQIKLWQEHVQYWTDLLRKDTTP